MVELSSLVDFNPVDPNLFQDWEKDLFSIIYIAINESKSDPCVSGKWLRNKLNNAAQEPELTVRIFSSMNEFIDSVIKASGITPKKNELKNAYIFTLRCATLKVKSFPLVVTSLKYQDNLTSRNLPKVSTCSDFVFYQISSGLIVDPFSCGTYSRNLFNRIANPMDLSCLEKAENALSFVIRSLKHNMTISKDEQECIKKFLKGSNQKKLWSAWKKLDKISWIWKSKDICEKIMEYLFFDLKISNMIFENPINLNEFKKCISEHNRGENACASSIILYTSFMLSRFWNSENESYIRNYLSKTLQSNDEFDIRIINVIESVKTLIKLFNGEFNLQEIAILIFNLHDDWDVALRVTSFIIEKEKNIRANEVYWSILNILKDSKVIEFVFSTLLTDINLEKYQIEFRRSKEEIRIEELKWRLNHPNIGQNDLIDYLDCHLLYNQVGPSMSFWDWPLNKILNALKEQITKQSNIYTVLKKYIEKMITNDEVELINDLKYLKDSTKQNLELIKIRYFANAAYLKLTPTALNLIENYSKKYFEFLYGENKIKLKQNENSQGIHIQLIIKVSAFNGFAHHYLVKYHHHGALNTSNFSSTSKRERAFRKSPVDLKELFVYLLFNLMGLGPECHFSGVDDKIFFIATKNCCFGDKGNWINFKTGSFLNKRYKNLHKNPYFIRKLLVTDILQRVLLISDITSHGSNFGFVDQGNQNLTNFQIIDHAPNNYKEASPGMYTEYFNYRNYRLRETKEEFPWGKVLNSKHKFERVEEALSELWGFYQKAEESCFILRDSYPELYKDDHEEYYSEKQRLSNASFEEILSIYIEVVPKEISIIEGHNIEENQKPDYANLMKDEIFEWTFLKNRWGDLERYVRGVKKNLNTFVEEFHKHPYYLSQRKLK